MKQPPTLSLGPGICLSQNPDRREARFHAELDAALAGRAPALDDLPRLPYTRRVLAESPAAIFAVLGHRSAGF